VGSCSLTTAPLTVLPQMRSARFQLFADQAAVAIRNAQQYDELRRAKNLVRIRTALAWMGMASSTWRHTIDKHA